jgi:hypothetical protein
MLYWRVIESQTFFCSPTFAILLVAFAGKEGEFGVKKSSEQAIGRIRQL